MVDARVVSLQHALECSFWYGLLNGTCACVDDCLHVDSGRIYLYILCQTNGEDCLGKAEEQSPSE